MSAAAAARRGIKPGRLTKLPFVDILWSHRSPAPFSAYAGPAWTRQGSGEQDGLLTDALTRRRGRWDHGLTFRRLLPNLTEVQTRCSGNFQALSAGRSAGRAGAAAGVSRRTTSSTRAWPCPACPPAPRRGSGVVHAASRKARCHREAAAAPGGVAAPLGVRDGWGAPAGLLVIAVVPHGWPWSGGVTRGRCQFCGFPCEKEKELRQAPAAGAELRQTGGRRGELTRSFAPGRYPLRACRWSEGAGRKALVARFRSQGYGRKVLGTCQWALAFGTKCAPRLSTIWGTRAPEQGSAQLRLRTAPCPPLAGRAGG